MYKKICLVFLVFFASSEGIQPTNYDISRNHLGRQVGGGNYGHQPGYYPGGGYPGGGYPGGGYPGGYYPGQHGPSGPPGAHTGCPLCDSSVYSYCYQKQAYDACCCGGGYNPFTCGKTDCNYLYANSCQEHNLITKCCCVDLYKNSGHITPTDVI